MWEGPARSPSLSLCLMSITASLADRERLSARVCGRGRTALPSALSNAKGVPALMSLKKETRVSLHRHSYTNANKLLLL